MRRELGAFLALGVALCLTGCQSWFKDPGLPRDPLFEVRKPVETKGKLQPPQDVPFMEITPPTDPYYLPALEKITKLPKLSVSDR